MSRDKLVDVNDPYHASVNVGCQSKSGPGKIHEAILVKRAPVAKPLSWQQQ